MTGSPLPGDLALFGHRLAGKSQIVGTFVNAEWRSSRNGDCLAIINPSSGRELGLVETSSAQDVDDAVMAAEKAFGTWQMSVPQERSRRLLDLADRLLMNAEELARLESANAGKPFRPTLDEVKLSADVFRFFAGAARCQGGLASGEYVSGRTSWTRRDPVGVVAQITPWNFPLHMASWKLGPALAAGNTVVLKPSELTPLTTLRLFDLASDLFPPGVINLVNGVGPFVGQQLAEHPRVRMISVTGDVATGQSVMRAAAGNLKRLHLELGGKAPVIVFDDADVRAVADCLKMASFWNAGQDCTAACRVLVAEPIADKLTDALVSRVRTISVGDPALSDVDMGPLISDRHRQRVAGYVDRARAAGATVLAGGAAEDGPGFFYQPTVVTNVRQADEIAQAEVFGPVVTLQEFTDEQQAISWANDTEYGLSASVWSQNLETCLRASKQLQFGVVWLNDHYTITNEMPHGGFKRSGFGKDMSTYSLDDYSVVKHVMARSGRSA